MVPDGTIDEPATASFGKHSMFAGFKSTLVVVTVIATVTAWPDASFSQVSRKTDAKKRSTGKPAPPEDPEFKKYGIYAQSAPRPATVAPSVTQLPLKLQPGARIALIGNALFERAQLYGYFETALHQRYPTHRLIVRNLSWSADTPDLQPRPDNFADTDQHLTHERIDVIFVAFGFNESFAGPAGLPAFRQSLNDYLAALRTKAFNGKSAAQIVLLSPIASESVTGFAEADRNNANLRLYTDTMREVAAKQQVGFADLFDVSRVAMQDPQTDLTINGVHLNQQGYERFANWLHRAVFGTDASITNEELRETIVDKNRQYFRRFRPLNTFYYTGGRNKSYGYLDFLPAMKNFDLMVANREQRIFDIAQERPVSEQVDDSNLPPLPETKESRGANRWITAKQELSEFQIDPRFEVNLFAGEEQFPDIAAPIQMRWDSRGRLWVSCSTTYPHVYPGNEPDDKLVILEDTDGDGRADRSTVFADDLHIPLSFEFGDGGVYVSEMPNLTFLKDNDGDGKADERRIIMTGFGTEDSHHALHDFAWTPDGDLLFRESIFHHSQVETPYGPVRQQNSGWFRFEPESHRLTSFGTYHSTNPWGVTFDDWGQHVASHPIYAAAFHSLDPPYPQQHPKPAGLRAYSGTCGQEFVDFASFPKELQGTYIKVRYKPTNRVEIHRWKESEFGYDEEYVSDLIFSSNLSFIPVDIRFGPRGALYICDWYNPIKGHAQYSLRDERRDRHSGRIWRVTAKGLPLQDPPQIAGASISELLEILKRPEYRYRYWAKRELRARQPELVRSELNRWVEQLDPSDARFRHHQLEAVWAYRNINQSNTDLLRDLLSCENRHARAAAVEQLRYWYPQIPDHLQLLEQAANDANGIVRMQAAIACSYVGTPEALQIVLQTLNHPSDKHVAYAIQCALGSHTLRRHWEGKSGFHIGRLLKRLQRSNELKEPTPDSKGAQFDTQPNLKTVRISCVPERMLFTRRQFAVTTGQPVKVVFTNPDATDHNLVFVQPDALAEVGMAANAMARDPRNANSDFIPEDKRALILHASPMIGPTRKSQVAVLRFRAPSEPGIYPYVCTFPGHWVIMSGVMVVADDLSQVASMLAASQPKIVQEWKLSDFENIQPKTDEASIMRGMQAFQKARCNQCHVVAGHGIKLGPDLTDVAKRFQNQKLLQQIIEPSAEINPKYLTRQFVLENGKIITGVVIEETPAEFKVATNLLIPNAFERVKRSQIEDDIPSRISSMPAGMVNVLTRNEIVDLLSFLQAGGYQLPEHLKHHHGHSGSKQQDQ